MYENSASLGVYRRQKMSHLCRTCVWQTIISTTGCHLLLVAPVKEDGSLGGAYTKGWFIEGCKVAYHRLYIDRSNVYGFVEYRYIDILFDYRYDWCPILTLSLFSTESDNLAQIHKRILLRSFDMSVSLRAHCVTELSYWTKMRNRWSIALFLTWLYTGPSRCTCRIIYIIEKTKEHFLSMFKINKYCCSSWSAITHIQRGAMVGTSPFFVFSATGGCH